MSIARRLLIGAALVLVMACRDSPSAPAPIDPSSGVSPIAGSGPVRITFRGANVSPGGTIAGCGPFVAGCIGRLRITVDLAPPLDGPVLYVRLYLHSMRNGVACLSGTTAPMTLKANQRMTVDVTLNDADVCGMPDTMATMDAIVEGPVEVASRQAWSLRYVFAP